MDNKKPRELKKLCDIQVRKYLLKNAERDGQGRILCPLKGVWYPENKIHVAHFIDRGRMNTRYNKLNLHLISEASNSWDSKETAEGFKSLHHKEYEEWLIEKIGQKNFEKLLELSKELVIFDRQKYLDVLQEYKTD